MTIKSTKRVAKARPVRVHASIVEAPSASLSKLADGRSLAPAVGSKQALQEADLQTLFANAGALVPPYDPAVLAYTYERSSALRPCVEAYETNIHGWGYQLVPVIDLDASDADDRIRDTITQEREAKGDFMPPTEQDVTLAREIIKRGMRTEKAALERFFEACSPDMSFQSLRKITCSEKEQTGNGYWEVVRNGYGEICQLVHMPTRSTRLRAMDPKFFDVPTPRKSSAISYQVVDVKRRFRSYVQILYGMPACYFKEFGDPRTISAKTGKFYRDVDALREAEGEGAEPGNEVVHWKIFSSLGPYGVPRWIGAALAVSGLRSAESVNFTYFDRKAVPPFAVLVSGGKLAKGAKEMIAEYLDEHHKGIENFHKIMILEADSSNSTVQNSRIRIELRNLMDAQLKDALFQTYEANCDRKIARQFRLPDLIRGASQEVNRAQAEAVLKFTEQQVFQGEREDFDHMMARILADMGIRFWKFASNSAPAKDPELLTDIGKQWVEAGVLTPGEGRDLAGEALNREFKPLETEEWTHVPQKLFLAGVLPGKTGGPTLAAAQAAPGETGGGPGGMPNVEERSPVQEALEALHGALENVAYEGTAEAAFGKRAKKRNGVKKILVPKAVIDKWFDAAGA